MKLLLDTHIWLWWINQSSELKQPHLDLLETADELYVSVISCWEITQLSQRQKLVLPFDHRDWFKLALDSADIMCLPMNQQIAIRAAELPDHHRDPADRFIIASALEYNLYLMSFDEKFHFYQMLQPFLLSRTLPDNHT